MASRSPSQLVTAARGRAVLADPRLNKGTAFSNDERAALGLHGLLPAAVESIDEQLVRARAEFDRLHDDLERHVYLRALQDHNQVLFHRFVVDNLNDTLPIVYTPTVGLATQQFSRIFRRPLGLFISYPQRGNIASLLATVEGDVDVIVVTDSGRILGLGDQGVGGMGIPIGKLSLYSAFGGIDPHATLPIVLDVGTDNAERLADPTYLGWRHERVTGPDYDEFVEEFVSAVQARFPGVLLQWEDFAQHNATTLLARYRDRLLSFNDDIQGTAAVALAALWGAARQSGRDFAEQKVCIVGAGSAGTGIATMIVAALGAQGVADPLAHVVLLDSKGVVHTGRSDLKPHQLPLAHPAEMAHRWGGDVAGVELHDVLAGFGATALVGVSGQPGAFSAAAVQALASNTDRPIVMPLSNPTSRAEATPADVLAWSEGRAIVATGSPFDPIEWGGERRVFSQANNVYVFPGLGLGAVVAKASKITDSMLMVAARTVAESALDGDASASGAVLPDLGDVARLSTAIAVAVVREAHAAGVAGVEFDSDEAISRAVQERRWSPVYPTVVSE